MNNHEHSLAISVEEAARRLGLGRTTLYALFQQGELRAIRVGHRTLVPTAELRRYVDRLMAEQHGEAAA